MRTAPGQGEVDDDGSVSIVPSRSPKKTVLEVSRHWAVSYLGYVHGLAMITLRSAHQEGSLWT